MIAPRIHDSDRAGEKPVRGRSAHWALGASLLVVSLFPSIGAAQSAPPPDASPTTVAPVPVVALPAVEVAPVEVAPQYPPYRPGRRPRVRTMVEPYVGGTIPPMSTLSTRANVAMIGAGAGTLGVGWLSAVVGWFATIRCGYFLSCSSASAWLLVPAVGPWLALSDRNLGHDGVALIVVDGLVQTGGIALMIAGGLIRHQVVVTTVVAEGRRGPQRPSASWTIAPLTGPGQYGLGMYGTF